MAMIKSFRDLEVYKLGLAEAKRLFLVTKTFPNEERYSLYRPNSSLVACHQWDGSRSLGATEISSSFR
jgi:hypothetical protein